MGHRTPPVPMTARDTVFVAGPHHMETVSGIYFDLANPRAMQVTLDDVAHHLSQVCRYAGATRVFYSVAEHAYLVAQRLRAQDHSVLIQLAGLHHDDAEAYVGDNTRPMKLRAPILSEIEAAVFPEVVAGLGLADLPFDDPAVKEADDWALSAEAYHLLPSRGAGWFSEGLYDREEPNSWLWRLGWDSSRAKVNWLRLHYELCGQAGLEQAMP